jgi:hypothetical protein
MKNGITFIFFLLIVISCKQKEAEIVEIKKADSEKIAETSEENLVSSKSPDCNIKTLVKINSILEKGSELNDQDFATFFANMNPNCSDNVEYNQFNNELIFKTLESNPKKFVAFLSRVSKKKEILDFVLTQLQNPINDGIELKNIHIKLNKTETEDAKMKELVLDSIKNAIDK